MRDKVKMMVDEIYPQLVLFRRTLHENPELSDQEFKTVASVCQILESAKVPYQKLQTVNGVVGLISGRDQGRVVALRADMDALPIQELNQTAYASKVKGVMHACGHDVHTTILIGTALVLNALKMEYNGQIKLLFQPAEETDGGAKRMIDEGCLMQPQVDVALGLHCHPDYDTGQIGLCYDVGHGSSDMLAIKVLGTKAHGAYPEQGVDAIVIAAQLITALQTLVSRNTSPFDPVVLSFGTISGGDAGNVIASSVELRGTLRTFDEQTRAFMLERIKETCEHISGALQGQAVLEITPGYIPLRNHSKVVDDVRSVATSLLGEDNVIIQKHGSLGVEDFAYFAKEVPSCFYNLGVRNVEKGIVSGLHSDTFDVDEESIRIGVTLQVLATLQQLGVTL